MDLERYAEQMCRYYQQRTHPDADWTPIGYAEALERDFGGAKPSMRELADAICEALADRDVIEYAAGLGQYARFLARTAKSLLATEATDHQATRMFEAVMHAQTLPEGRFRTKAVNANRPDEVPGRYSAALAVNWFQHLPYEQTRDWIERLHRVLLPGARVFIAINHLSGQNRWTLYFKPNDPNLYESRRTYDGEPVEIIDNVYSRADLMSVFAPYARNIQCFCGKSYHWVVYDRP